jgi:hypothetical protein
MKDESTTITLSNPPKLSEFPRGFQKLIWAGSPCITLQHPNLIYEHYTIFDENGNFIPDPTEIKKCHNVLKTKKQQISLGWSSSYKH